MVVQSGKKRKALFISFISSVFLSVFLFNPSANQVVQAAPSAITGTVYRDYNSDGDQDSLEPGIEGINVIAYADNNVVAGSTTTASDGTYNLSASSAGPFRLEFTPNADQESWLKSGVAQSTGNGTTVVFVSDPAGEVNVGFQGLADYCDPDVADVATTCYVFGDSASPVLPDAVVSTDYLRTGNYDVNSFAFNTEAGVSQVGSVYGLAYQRTTTQMFSSSHLKRHSDFGPNGPGAVYVTNYGGTADATLYVDLNNVKLPNGTQLSASTAGVDPRDESSITGTYPMVQGTSIVNISRFWFHDPASYAEVGKMSLGDIDISDDDSTLYIVNMKDRKLYIVDATQAAPVDTLLTAPIAIPNDCANPDDARPMALNYNDGKVYVGVTCSAESSQNLNDLTASVYSFDPIAFSFDTTPLVTIPMSYDRGCIYRDNSVNPTEGLNNPIAPADCFQYSSATVSNTANWRPWQPDWTVAFDNTQNSGLNHFTIEYPQPILSDIEFDNGDMIIGFRDVNGDRTGDCAGAPDASITPQTGCAPDDNYASTQYGQGIYRGNGMGDTLRACGNPSTGWTLENNGTCGGVTTSGQNIQQGLGGGEYYWQDQGPTGPGGVSFGTYFGGHDETTMGALAQIPGQPDLVTTMSDSNNFYDAGFAYFANATGQTTTATDGFRRLEVYPTMDAANVFGKSNGLGDIEPICGLAPIQIGNRVWNDANANGVQDPGESGVGNAQVTLTCGADSASVFTQSDGSYLFTNGPTGNVQFVDTGESCTLTVGNLAGNLEITSGTMAVSDLHDNDADENGVIEFVVAPAGDNNHNLDFGVTESSNVPIEVGDAAIGNYVWLDENNDGVQDAGERGIPNVTIMLTEAGGAMYQTVTDADGKYLFPSLPAGTYTVKVNGTNFVAGGSLDGFTQTTLVPGDADFGNKDDAAYVIALALGDENLTADFGYNVNTDNEVNNNTGNAAVGDRVWVDLDGDGVQDPNETGVEDAGVAIYSPGADGLLGTPDDVLVDQTTTDANGNYMFDDLPAGAYTICVTGSSSASADVLDTSLYTQTGDPDHFARPVASLGADPLGLAGDNCTTQPVVLAPGDVYVNVDFGYEPTASAPIGSIGNTIWFDADADQNGPAAVNGDSSNGAGADDAAEQPIPSVTVALIKDLDGNGIFDAGEPIVASDVTDENGQYFFGGLPLEQCDGGGAGIAQNYIVWVNDTDAVLTDMVGTYDSDGDSGGGTALTGNAVYGVSAATLDCNDRDDVDQDFGYTSKGHFEGAGLVGDTVWFDNDSDGVQDADEPGVEGVTLTLLDGAGAPIGATVTDENGNYSFGNLDLGASYMVQVNSSNFTAGGVLQGMNQTYDNDGSPTAGNKGTSATLTAGSPVDLGLDFGYVGASNGRLGNLVWLDLNANGVYNATNGESTIPDVTMALYRDLDCNGLVDADDVLFGKQTTVSSIDATQYGSNGIYRFNNLPIVGAGPNGGACYVVDVTDDNGVLAGYWHSLGTLGISNNSQPDPYGGNTVLELRSGATENLTADFGYYVDPACVGNHVFVDGNGDNLQGDVSDYGLSGVQLNLDIAYQNGNVTLSTLSGANGFYQFCNLLLDEDYNDSANANEPNFTISAVTPAGLNPITPNVGSNDLIDGDVNVSALPTQGQTDVTAQNPASNESDPIASYDFGFQDVEIDYGDLPSPYDTTAADNGASHVIIAGLKLGASVDGETDGQPSGTAEGDDNNGDDEDGILATPTDWTDAVDGGEVTVIVMGDGCLNGWIDWDSDGSFDDVGEYVINNEIVSGTNSPVTISFNIPAGGTAASPRNARFRLTPRDGANGCSETVATTGLVNGGEVEDYQFIVSDATAVSLSNRDVASPTNLVLIAVVALAGMLGVTVMSQRKQIQSLKPVEAKETS